MAEAHNLLATLALDRRDYTSAEAHIDDAMSINARDITAVSLLARSEIEQGNPQNAIGLLESAIDPNAKGSGLKMALATAYIQSKQFDKAKDTLSAVLAQNPDYVPAKMLMLEYFFEVEDFDSLLAYAGEIIKAEDAPARAYAYEGLAKLHKGDGDGGMASITKALEIQGDEPLALQYVVRGLCP